MDEVVDQLSESLKDAEAELSELNDRRDELAETIRRLRGALEALRGSERPASMNGGRSHTGKYRRLFDYLVGHEAEPISLSFAEVERILGFPLPPSSRRHMPHWYGYEGSAVARAIRDAGWRARHVSLEDESLELWPEDMVDNRGPAW